MNDIRTHPASFRDPAGFVFSVDGVFYRQVNLAFKEQYDRLMKSGLYDHLVRENLLIPHSETLQVFASKPGHYKTLLPQQVPRLSYPSEWSPGQLRDAALVTLKIQLIGMEHGMTLKDAAPFNIQFMNGQPIFIDSLSFDLYDHAKPWIAYRQFCENFLFPLYLHRYAQTGTGRISAAWPDGISVAMTARLLPFKSRWNAGAWLHVFLQRRVSMRKTSVDDQKLRFSKAKLTNLIEHLQSIVNGLSSRSKNASTWSNYYAETVLNKDYLESKQKLFRQYLEDVEFADSLDLGCNDGLFSKILAETGKPVIAVDSDWQCIDKLYRDHAPNILPLCIDLANPTPATGFSNAEHASFSDRAEADLVVALALIHHLALGNNIPLNLIAGYFSRLTKRQLITEFIPLSDEKAKALISRKNTMPVGYDVGTFETTFSMDFRIERKDVIPGTDRTIYLLTKR